MSSYMRYFFVKTLSCDAIFFALNPVNTVSHYRKRDPSSQFFSRVLTEKKKIITI